MRFCRDAFYSIALQIPLGRCNGCLWCCVLALGDAFLALGALGRCSEGTLGEAWMVLGGSWGAPGLREP